MKKLKHQQITQVNSTFPKFTIGYIVLSLIHTHLFLYKIENSYSLITHDKGNVINTEFNLYIQYPHSTQLVLLHVISLLSRIFPVMEQVKALVTPDKVLLSIFIALLWGLFTVPFILFYSSEVRWHSQASYRQL